MSSVVEQIRDLFQKRGISTRNVGLVTLQRSRGQEFCSAVVDFENDRVMDVYPLRKLPGDYQVGALIKRKCSEFYSSAKLLSCVYIANLRYICNLRLNFNLINYPQEFSVGDVLVCYKEDLPVVELEEGKVPDSFSFPCCDGMSGTYHISHPPCQVCAYRHTHVSSSCIARQCVATNTSF